MKALIAVLTILFIAGCSSQDYGISAVEMMDTHYVSINGVDTNIIYNCENGSVRVTAKITPVDTHRLSKSFGGRDFKIAMPYFETLCEAEYENGTGIYTSSCTPSDFIDHLSVSYNIYPCETVSSYFEFDYTIDGTLFTDGRGFIRLQDCLVHSDCGISDQIIELITRW